jgi:IclR family KDG regulon transcriptional repressor
MAAIDKLKTTATAPRKRAAAPLTSDVDAADKG